MVPQRKSLEEDEKKFSNLNKSEKVSKKQSMQICDLSDEESSSEGILEDDSEYNEYGIINEKVLENFKIPLDLQINEEF